MFRAFHYFAGPVFYIVVIICLFFPLSLMSCSLSHISRNFVTDERMKWNSQGPKTMTVNEQMLMNEPAVSFTK